MIAARPCTPSGEAAAEPVAVEPESVDAGEVSR
jgi:hypothetical protein